VDSECVSGVVSYQMTAVKEIYREQYKLSTSALFCKRRAHEAIGCSKHQTLIVP
jgi:hypothetical protein